MTQWEHLQQQKASGVFLSGTFCALRVAVLLLVLHYTIIVCRYDDIAECATWNQWPTFQMSAWCWFLENTNYWFWLRWFVPHVAQVISDPWTQFTAEHVGYTGSCGSGDKAVWPITSGLAVRFPVSPILSHCDRFWTPNCAGSVWGL